MAPELRVEFPRGTCANTSPTYLYTCCQLPVNTSCHMERVSMFSCLKLESISIAFELCVLRVVVAYCVAR